MNKTTIEMSSSHARWAWQRAFLFAAVLLGWVLSLNALSNGEYLRALWDVAFLVLFVHWTTKHLDCEPPTWKEIAEACIEVSVAFADRIVTAEDQVEDLSQRNWNQRGLVERMSGRINLLTQSMETIEHSVDTALVPGNDKMRELSLIKATVDNTLRADRPIEPLPVTTEEDLDQLASEYGVTMCPECAHISSNRDEAAAHHAMTGH